MPKRLLRYALAKFDIFEDDALDLDNLDLGFGFRNNVGDAELTNWVSPQSEQIAFGRGKSLQEHVSGLVQSCDALCRCPRLRGDQQRGRRLVDNVLDVSSGWLVLRRHQRLVF